MESTLVHLIRHTDPIMKLKNMKTKSSKSFPLAAIIGTALAVASAQSNAATVWNVNLGPNTASGGSNQITTSDNFIGAASENTANSTWNGFNTAPSGVVLADSTGVASAGVTLTVTSSAGFAIQDSGAVGAEIFRSHFKSNGNNSPVVYTFGGLSAAPGITYSLVVYSAWGFGVGGIANQVQTVTQTAGAGLSGAFHLNFLQMNAGNPLAGGGVAQDTNSANVSGDFNYTRFDNLTADGSGNLTLNFARFGNAALGANAPVNGFQLVQIPEPSSAVLLGLAGFVLAQRRRR